MKLKGYRKRLLSIKNLVILRQPSDPAAFFKEATRMLKREGALK
jgi:hypothetical protein